MKNKKHSTSGQTLVMLLVFMALIVTITTATVTISIVLSMGNTRAQLGAKAYDIAESGVENALLRLLRDPNYTGESNLPVGAGTVSTVVSGTPITIISTGQIGTYIRKIQVEVTLGDTLTILTWKEIQ